MSVARTKAEHLALLGQAEPGVDHSGLSGAALEAKLKQHKIGALRTKQELVDLLAQKQSALQQAKIAAAQMAGAAPLPDLAAMPVSQLKEMAKSEDISLNMTKQDTIELLDKIEPGVDHSGLSGKDLAAAKKKHGIGVLKNKQQLVEALQKKAGQQMAQEAAQETDHEKTLPRLQNIWNRGRAELPALAVNHTISTDIKSNLPQQMARLERKSPSR